MNVLAGLVAAPRKQLSPPLGALSRFSFRHTGNNEFVFRKALPGGSGIARAEDR